MPGGARVLRKPEIAATESSARAEFARQQSHKGEPGPLAEAKRLEQLLLRVFDGQRDGVDGGNRQRAPRSANDLAERY